MNKVEWTLPGTMLSVDADRPQAAEEVFSSLFLAGGLVLSQVMQVTGLEPYIIQNWVRRGFLAPPKQRKYTRRQLSRILMINALKSALSIEQICKLLSYINGALDDEGDDTIDDTELYGAFVLVAGSVQKHGLTSESEMNRLIADGLKDYKEAIPGAKERIEQALRIMITAWRAAQLQTKAQSMMNALYVRVQILKKEKFMFEEFKGTGIPIPTPKKPSGDFLKKLPKIVLIVVIALVLLAVVASSWYTVNDKEQAVVTTFGKVTDITDAGFHFKLPFGIQKVEKVNVNVYQKIELGYRSVGSADNFDIIESETKMITGDYNIVDVEFFVEYKVSDPEKYLYGSYDPETILRNLLQSQVRNVVGSEAVDAVLTTGKESIQMRVKELVSEILQEYDIGLTLVDVKIQDSDPPTDEVTEAFKAVETAKQQAETVRNEARAYQNAQLPQAEAKADELLRNAEYLKQKRINEATEQVAMFEAMYKEYSQNPGITRSRMYYEAISEALPDVKVYIDTSGENGVQKVLPLESFTQGDVTTTAPEKGEE